MKYALIGCGRVSGNHIKAAKLNELDIVALCDIIPEKAEVLKKEFSLNEGIPVYSDYKKMLDEIMPDFVGIATDSGTHAEIAIYCAEHKTNFIVEKPLAMFLQFHIVFSSSPGKFPLFSSSAYQFPANLWFSKKLREIVLRLQ